MTAEQKPYDERHGISDYLLECCRDLTAAVDAIKLTLDTVNANVGGLKDQVTLVSQGLVILTTTVTNLGDNVKTLEGSSTAAAQTISDIDVRVKKVERKVIVPEVKKKQWQKELMQGYKQLEAAKADVKNPATTPEDRFKRGIDGLVYLIPPLKSLIDDDSVKEQIQAKGKQVLNDVYTQYNALESTKSFNPAAGFNPGAIINLLEPISNDIHWLIIQSEGN